MFVEQVIELELKRPLIAHVILKLVIFMTKLFACFWPKGYQRRSL